MRRKGFTLVELLAVIVILAIILAIAIPGISGIINSATRGSFESDAKMVLQQLEYEKLVDEDFNVTSVTEDTITNLKLSNDNYDDLRVGLVDGKPYIIIVGKNKWNGLKACGYIRNISVVPSSDTSTCEDIPDSLPVSDYIQSEGVNKPKLAPGMTAIKWNGTTEQTISDPNTDASWYDYSNSEWANAKTADGSYWVWIPRYIYKISSGWHTNNAGTVEVQFSKDTNDNWNSTVIGNIDTGSTADSSNNKWTNHPAFNFGGTELTGIWVAKFEATASEGVDNGIDESYSCPLSGDNVTTKTVKIIPNAISWRCIEIGKAFDTIRGMENSNVYGWGTTGNGIDTHLIKEIEWGSALFLSKSIYGKNDEPIWLNPADNGTTGCAGDSATSGVTTGCTNQYNSLNGVKASTTGNIYGIYDMSGGAWEFISAYVDNGDASLNTYGASIIDANSKYKDVYTVGTPDNMINNYAQAINKKGDAIYEVSNDGSDTTNAWFGGWSRIPYLEGPFSARGDHYTSTLAGGFSFGNASGEVKGFHAFRPILVVASEL